MACRFLLRRAVREQSIAGLLTTAPIHSQYNAGTQERPGMTTSATAVKESDYSPFGGVRVVVNNDPNAYKFTGKERDPESGLDYFGARYYAAQLGRFMSPDEFTGGPVDAFSSNDPLVPGPLPYGDITNPQSLNKYAYTYNNPLNLVDPDGHCPVCEEIIEAAMEEVDKVAKPLIESAYKNGSSAAKKIGLGLGILASLTVGAEPLGDGTLPPEFRKQQEQKQKEKSQQHAEGQAQPKSGTRTQPSEQGAEHKKGARPSTKEKDEEGQARKNKDQGGERADEKRKKHGMYPRKRPPGHKGPWPPKPQEQE
jgi:RHS repeat-associated protein